MKYTLTALLLGCLSLLSAQEEFSTTTALFGDLRARQIGPAVMSGRVSCLAVNPQDPTNIFVGAAGGGVWRTTSGSGVFTPVFDDHTQSIGDIAIAPSDPQVVYIGTGEPWPRNSVSVGTGVYKSTNGGIKWTSVGLENTERIADVLVHPKDARVVYVAALGHLWDSNEERGVYKSTDGGESWERILYIDEDTGAASLSMDPNNPDVLFAAMWSHRRQPWTFDSGLHGASGLFKTTDGGVNWEKLTNGLPNEKLGRIGVTVAPGNGQVVYASVETGTEETKGMYRSADGGASWEMTGLNWNTSIRPFYFSKISIAPSNDSIVAKCGLNGIISENAGKTWRSFDNAVHSDFHDIWFNPDNSKHIIVATDGGVYESLDRGYTFKMWMNLPLSQFYHVSVDHAKPYRVYGGLQDNGSWFGPSRSGGGITNSDWKKTFGGDGFYSFRHPEKEHIVFSEYQGGKLVRFDERTGRAKAIPPYATAGEDPLRFNWNAPLLISKDGKRLYFAAQYLYRSTDDGDSWERISPDLTTNDPEKQKQYLSGGLSIDNSTAENHTTIYTVAESPLNKEVVWVGTDDGNLQLTKDGGQSWTLLNANLPNLPANTWVTFVEPSPHDPNTAFVTFDGHRTGDMTPYLYVTRDGGKTWSALCDDNVSGYALSVRQDLVNENLLFLGTEFGLYISLDAGTSWAPFRNNLPRVGIRDMVIQEREADLVMATHGRGIIILDDLEALRQLTPEITANKFVFLETKPAYLGNGTALGTGDFGGSGTFVGPNPSTAARVMYYNQRRHMFGKMYVEIWKDGELLRTLPAGKGAGLNVVSLPTTIEKPKAAPSDNRMALFGTLSGPSLPAGTYQVKLIKGKTTYETEFELTTEEEDIYTVEKRAAQRELLMQVYNDTEELAYIYHVLAKLKEATKNMELRKKKLQELAKTINTAVGAEMNRLVFLGGDGYVNEGSRLREEMGTLYFDISSYPGEPSESQRKEANRIHEAMVRTRASFDAMLSGPVAELNAKLDEDQKISWETQAEFLAAESGGSDAGQQRQRWTESTLWKDALNNPIGLYWIKSLMP
ncbi:MAG: hypothetical protein RIC19_24610 [Phaeodactylibacter sp.]|uniref:WD40/YVTN/BNR-like repeat-containing protein n=1 Tax=Phaeodactylibacter sp. TaxID=1940289 RepID=UPI0032F00845